MLIDSYARKIDYLRISVTDRCNLRCVYCMPEAGIAHKMQEELLSFEEIVRIVKLGVKLGIDKIRLTGGEPLVRKDVAKLIGYLNAIEGVKDIALTTNGILLKEHVSELRQAGLKRINISLDSLSQDRYRFISRQGNLEEVLEGIKAAVGLGFSPLKINVLLLNELNENELIDFLRLCIENPLHIRFLEFMPVNSFYKTENCISGRQVLSIAGKFCDFQQTKIYGNGPAKVYKFKNSQGTFGIIAPLSDKFCFNCNRLRLTSDGFLKPCLHSELKINLRDPLRQGADENELIRLITQAVRRKPREHSLDEKALIGPQDYSMCQVGG